MTSAGESARSGAMGRWLTLWGITAAAFVLARLAARLAVRRMLAVDTEILAEMIVVPIAQAVVLGVIRTMWKRDL